MKKSTESLLYTLAMGLFTLGTLAQAATITGTVTNKSTSKPSAGDTVVLVDVQSGMSEVAQAKTDASGRYTLNPPGSGPYLIRATHQGATYFIAAPQGKGEGDLTVYDAAANVEQVGVTGDVIEFETGNGQLFVNERYYVHNNSNPQRTQLSAHGFEISLPEGAVLDGAAASRPSSTMPTNAQPTPAGTKGHYYINIPIQPSQGEKDTVFDLRYHLPYKGGSFQFKSWESLPADAVIVVLPKSMSLTSNGTAKFQLVPEDPAVQTYAVKNIGAGKSADFTIGGSGTMPREEQNAQSTQAMGDSTQPGSQPGGGMAAPINTPDPLSKYKWWLMSLFALLLAGGAAFLLRKPTGAATAEATSFTPAIGAAPVRSTPALLDVLKEELFALESEKLSGTLSDEDYTTTKAALEIVLKRALQRK